MYPSRMYTTIVCKSLLLANANVHHVYTCLQSQTPPTDEYVLKPLPRFKHATLPFPNEFLTSLLVHPSVPQRADSSPTLCPFDVLSTRPSSGTNLSRRKAIHPSFPLPPSNKRSAGLNGYIKTTPEVLLSEPCLANTTIPQPTRPPRCGKVGRVTAHTQTTMSPCKSPRSCHSSYKQTPRCELAPHLLNASSSRKGNLVPPVAPPRQPQPQPHDRLAISVSSQKEKQAQARASSDVFYRCTPLPFQLHCPDTPPCCPHPLSRPRQLLAYVWSLGDPPHTCTDPDISWPKFKSAPVRCSTNFLWRQARCVSYRSHRLWVNQLHCLCSKYTGFFQ